MVWTRVPANVISLAAGLPHSAHTYGESFAVVVGGGGGGVVVVIVDYHAASFRSVLQLGELRQSRLRRLQQTNTSLHGLATHKQLLFSWQLCSETAAGEEVDVPIF